MLNIPKGAIIGGRTLNHDLTLIKDNKFYENRLNELIYSKELLEEKLNEINEENELYFHYIPMTTPMDTILGPKKMNVDII